MGGSPIIPISFKARIPKDKITPTGFFVEPIHPEKVVEYVSIDAALFDFHVSPNSPDDRHHHPGHDSNAKDQKP